MAIPSNDAVDSVLYIYYIGPGVDSPIETPIIESTFIIAGIEMFYIMQELLPVLCTQQLRHHPVHH